MKRLVYTHDKNRMVVQPHRRRRTGTHLIRYILQYKQMKSLTYKIDKFISTLIEAPYIVYDERAIVVKCRNMKFKLHTNSPLTASYLATVTSVSKLYKTVCLLLKLSSENAFWSESVHDSIATTAAAASSSTTTTRRRRRRDSTTSVVVVNLLSSALVPDKMRSQFTLRPCDEEYACSFATLRTLPLEGTFYFIVDPHAHPRLFERMLFLSLYALISAKKNNRTLNIHAIVVVTSSSRDEYRHTITNPLLLRLFNTYNKSSSSSSSLLDDLVRSRAPTRPCTDMYTVQKCALVKYPTINIVDYDI